MFGFLFVYSLTTDEARVFADLLLLLLLRPQVCERVDDDTKDEVENDDDDNEEEGHVVDHPEREEGLLLGGASQDVPYPASVPQPVVQGRYNAQEQGVAGAFLTSIGFL